MRFVSNMDLLQRNSDNHRKKHSMIETGRAGRKSVLPVFIEQNERNNVYNRGGQMRMYGYLREPYLCNSTKTIYKVMIHEIDNLGVYTYYYTGRDAVFSSYDSFSEKLETALEEFEGELDDQGWIMIDDPLPYCQHDCILPIRVKGRETGHPQWGSYEILSDGQWVEYDPTKDIP